MTKLFATGFEDSIEGDRPALHVTAGAGNTDQPEVHLAFVDPHDPENGERIEVGGWFNKDQLIAAILGTTHEPLVGCGTPAPARLLEPDIDTAVSRAGSSIPADKIRQGEITLDRIFEGVITVIEEAAA